MFNCYWHGLVDECQHHPKVRVIQDREAKLEIAGASLYQACKHGYDTRSPCGECWEEGFSAVVAERAEKRAAEHKYDLGGKALFNDVDLLRFVNEGGKGRSPEFEEPYSPTFIGFAYKAARAGEVVTVHYKGGPVNFLAAEDIRCSDRLELDAKGCARRAKT